MRGSCCTDFKGGNSHCGRDTATQRNGLITSDGDNVSATNSAFARNKQETYNQFNISLISEFLTSYILEYDGKYICPYIHVANTAIVSHHS